MKKILFLTLCLISMLTACDETTDTVGSSLTNKEDIITVSDNIFKITSRSVAVESVLSRNALGYLGLVKDPETGAYVKSNFMTEFTILEDNNGFANQKYLVDGIKADSCTLNLFYDKFFGDSLTSMKATVYEMQKPIEETTNYYSSFNPEEAGLIRIGDGALQASRVYSIANTNLADSVRNKSGYTKHIRFMLNDPYTDANGVSYNNYGTYIMQKYYENPDNFTSAYKFQHNVCPGFYVKVDNGVGSMAYISNTGLYVYYTATDTTTHAASQFFRGTEEVRQITNISNDKERIQQLVDDNSCTYIKSPAGIFTELTLPIDEICKGHEQDSINSAKVTLRCYTSIYDGDYTLPAPTTLLVIKADSLQSFFENRELPDNRNTYLASYSSTTNTYTLNNIAQLVHNIYKEAAGKDDAWKAAHPNWNKVLLVPVTPSYTTYSSTSILGSITHDMTLSSIRLVGGSQNTQGDIEMSVIYSKYDK